MSSINKVTPLGQMLRAKLDAPARNSVGTIVPSISAEKQLTRLVLASMLWEKQFYLEGKSHTELIAALIKQVDPERVGVVLSNNYTRFDQLDQV